jgi:hypothetical protein
MGLHQHTHEMTWRCVAIVGFDGMFFCHLMDDNDAQARGDSSKISGEFTDACSTCDPCLSKMRCRRLDSFSRNFSGRTFSKQGSLHWFYALVLCTGSMHWLFYALVVLCTGSMHWLFYALVLCTGCSMHWFYAHIHAASQSTESPILFRSCGHETPFSDQKWASKIGDSVLCSHQLAHTASHARQ